MSVVARMTGRLLRNGLPGLIALLVGIALFEFVQPVVIASFGGAGELTAIMQRIPPALQAFARARPEFLALSGLAGYLSLGFTHPLYILLAGATVVGFTARSLAGEMDRGIIQIPLARPISRPVVYAARLLGVAIICAILAVTGPAGMIAGILFARPEGEFAFQHLAAVAINSLALFWAIAGLSLWGSAAATSAGRVIAWSLSLLVVSYFIDYFASIWRPLQSIVFLSIFTYYDPTQALVTGALDRQAVVILAIVGTVAAIAGAVVFTQRDLPA
ncbi:MAG: ABC transporter permease subunit [Thermomicrobiales bacterium]|nr:ABC transporter permease subunit [Thermomicrobiales bacterium]